MSESRVPLASRHFLGRVGGVRIQVATLHEKVVQAAAGEIFSPIAEKGHRLGVDHLDGACAVGDDHRVGSAVQHPTKPGIALAQCFLGAAAAVEVTPDEPEKTRQKHDRQPEKDHEASERAARAPLRLGASLFEQFRLGPLHLTGGKPYLVDLLLGLGTDSRGQRVEAGVVTEIDLIVQKGDGPVHEGTYAVDPGLLDGIVGRQMLQVVQFRENDVDPRLVGREVVLPARQQVAASTALDLFHAAAHRIDLADHVVSVGDPTVVVVVLAGLVHGDNANQHDHEQGNDKNGGDFMFDFHGRVGKPEAIHESLLACEHTGGQPRVSSWSTNARAHGFGRMRAEGLPTACRLLSIITVLYRLSVAAIVAFWLLMAALLVRTELLPSRADSLPVPVGYVGRLVFRHELASDLVLFRQRRRGDGNFHLQPKRLTPNDARGGGGNLLNVSGNFLLNLPGATGQRMVFHGVLETDDSGEVRHVDFSVSLHQPRQTAPGVTLHVDGSPAQRQWHYQMARGGETLHEGSGTPEQLLENFDLRAYGIDPGVFSRVGPQAASVRLTAQRGKLRVGEDDIDTYVVTIHHSDALETTIHVSQLGQVLAVKTFLGFDLYDETISP